MSAFLKLIVLFAATAALCVGTPRHCFAEDVLMSEFRNPPDSAKPHTWWHWMNGNVTREGITADLEAMKSAGIGGAQLFHVGQNIPPGPVGYMTPQWQEMVLHSVKEAARVGLELCIHNCAGWSSSAGPWITPEHAMQVIAWSDNAVRGPARFAGILPKPKAPQVAKAVDFYRDIAVLAFPAPAGGDTPIAAKKILGKTGVTRQNLTEPNIATTESATAIPGDDIIVLTEKMDADGRLTWEVPQGDWVILRIGYTPTGAVNRAAPTEGVGLEVDKLSREALDVHWNGMMARVIADAGPLAGKVLNNALIDSYEVGNQNWTPKFREEFRKRRGYDLLKYLPVVTGRTVGSTEESERFLWDFRRTIADLFADHYFRYFRELCHKHGIQFSTEGYGNGGYDNLQCSGLADIPMGEFWVGGGHYMKSTKLASSAAHTNARRFVGAEAFTASVSGGRYQLEPYGVKTLGDLAFCNGINRYIFHRYAHQPWMNLVPGMTMGKWGMHLERTITWWDEASAWFKYIARCQHLLQEGRFVADAVYFYGEGAPNDLPERAKLKPAIPDGYDYDGCDATVLLERMSVRDGRIVLPDGMSYGVLVLPDSTFMTPHTGGKIRDLVRSGATVVGPKPQQSPSLTDYPACDENVRRIAEEVWSNVDGDQVKEHTFGKGRVIWGVSLQDVFAQLKTPPDFEYQVHTPHGKLAHIHRRIGDADVYFVSNQLYSAVEADCTFRISGRAPELWRPETGTGESASVYREEAGRTVVPLRLEPAESLFVVFRRTASRNHVTNIAFVDHVQPVRPEFREGSAKTSDAAPHIVLHKASYETTDGRHRIDVTTQVAEMVAQGIYDIPAVADIYGDPKRGALKQLRVEYELDGKPMTKTVGDRATLLLADIAYSAPAPAFDVSATTTGVSTLIPWQPGTYSYRMSGGTTQTLHVTTSALSMKVSTPWIVKFAPGPGAPAPIQMQDLVPWNEHADSGVRYFAGSAEYVTEFLLPAEMLGPARAVELDLGRVKNFATVRLNGQELGVLWKAPFRINVDNALKVGTNRLEVKVTNLWPNRLIGDEQLPADVEWKDDSLEKWPDWLVQEKPRPSPRVTFTTWRFYDKNSPLLESGLLGPVTLRSAEQVVLGQTLRVLSYNMHHGRGTDDRIDLPRIAGVIKDSNADLVALQEVDIKTRRSNGVDQVAELERLTGMAGKFGKGRDFEGGDYGQAILSRYPIKSSEVHHLPGTVPGDTDLRIALSAVIDGPSTGTELLFVTTHLHHEKEAHRMVQATRLLEVLDEQKTSPVIIAGDFNAEPGSRVMELLCSRLQDNTTSDALTYPSDKPKKKIDWIFCSPTGGLRLLNSSVIAEAAASDHRPVIAELLFPE